MGARSSRVALILLACLAGRASASHGADGRSQVEAVGEVAPGGRTGAGDGHRYTLVCGDTLTVWRKARDPGTRDACALVVRARASLWSRPALAAEEAARALQLAPDSLEALTARAAAVHASGSFGEAHLLFVRAVSGASRDDWAALPSTFELTAARAASLAGFRREALEHYRAVILALDRVERPHERARVLLEAALLASRDGPASTAEAWAYFHQASGHPSPRLAVVRFLVGRALGLSTAAEEGDDAEVEEAWEQVRWMHGGASPPRGAPGELLPVLPPELMAEILLPAQLDEHPTLAADEAPWQEDP